MPPWSDDRMVLPKSGYGTGNIRRYQIPLPDDGLDGGERKLRVVGVLATGVTLDFREAPEQGFSAWQLVFPVALEGGPEGIPDGTAEETTDEAASHVGVGIGHGVRHADSALEK
jgi:hypothetical protein